MTEDAIQHKANDARPWDWESEGLARSTQSMPLLDPWPTRAGVVALGAIAALCIFALLLVSFGLERTAETLSPERGGGAVTAPSSDVVTVTTGTEAIAGLRLMVSILGVVAGTVVGALAGLLVVARQSPMPVVRQDAIGQDGRGRDEAETRARGRDEIPT